MTFEQAVDLILDTPANAININRKLSSEDWKLNGVKSEALGPQPAFAFGQERTSSSCDVHRCTCIDERITRYIREKLEDSRSIWDDDDASDNISRPVIRSEKSRDDPVEKPKTEEVLLDPAIADRSKVHSNEVKPADNHSTSKAPHRLSGPKQAMKRVALH